MKNKITSLKRGFALAAALVFLAGTSLFAQPPASAPTTKILVDLTVKAGASRDELMKTLPDEVRATVKLYLEGKIDQWYSRADGKGVVFLVNGKDADEVRALMQQLPLAKDGLADVTCTPLSPLTPLRFLMPAPAAAHAP